MALQRTANLGLNYPQSDDRNWDVPLVASLLALDASGLGALGCKATLVDSAGAPTGLGLLVAAGSFLKADGTVGTFAGGAAPSANASAAPYYWLTEAGVVTAGTGWPGTNHVRLCVVVAGPTAVTSIADARLMNRSAAPAPAFLPTAGGALNDGANVAFGTTTGTKLGTAANQKSAVFGVTPVAQPAGAAQAAVGALTTQALTDSTGGTVSTTLAAVSDVPTANALASLASQHARVLADLTSLQVLANAIRAALVAWGPIKGSA